MSHFSSRLWTMTFVVLGLVIPSSTGAEHLSPTSSMPGPGLADTSTVESDRLDPTQRELVAWATSRFDAAGLVFPSVAFIFRDDLSECDGHVGLFYPESHLLLLCRLDKKSMLHELAHAWAADNLDADARDAFVRFRNLDNWNDHETSWDERGTEHAAEILTWGLMDRNMLVPWITESASGQKQGTYRLLTIEDSDPDQLVDAYRLLTSRIPDERVSDDPRFSLRVESFSPEIDRSH